MELRLQKPALWARLRGGGGSLRSWALGRELALGTTCDQLAQPPEEVQSAFALQGGQLESAEGLPLAPLEPSEPAVGAHLWMWVDPNLVCPVPGHYFAQVLLPPPPSSGSGSLPAAGPEGPCSTPACRREDPLPLPSEAANKVTQGEDASQPGRPPPPQAEGTCRPVPGEAHPRKAKGSRSRGRKPRRVQGGWPRPPLNYCVLISLALNSSVNSSLTVQEIYQFTRQHFPFFRTAPEGWKNTVRHNLCFSSSFEKTTNFVCLEGNRKSRLWRLTTEGQRKFQEEARALPEDTMGLVHESMERPELMRSLFGL